MNVLIASATVFEIEPLIAFLDKEWQQQGHFHYQKGDRDIHILITGIGMIATSYSLTKRLAEQPFDLAIQAGVAGSFDRSIPLGTVVVVETEMLGDTGAEDHDTFMDVFDLGLADENGLPFKNRKLVNSFENIPFEINIPRVSSLTVNTVSGSSITAATRQEQFHCSLESMEGAAFHYICLQERIPFLQIRGISNYVEARDKSKWKMKEAIQSLNTILISLFGK